MVLKQNLEKFNKKEFRKTPVNIYSVFPDFDEIHVF